MRFRYFLSLTIFLSILYSCAEKKNTETPETTDDGSILQYTVVSVLPHDAEAFTEGLVIHNNKILESTGQNNSWIAEVNPGSGQSNKKVTLDAKYFGEGITVFNNKIYQLTWTTKVGFIYDANSYEKLGEFPINTEKNNEGWGLTNDNKNLIMSDGSEKIYFMDTTSFTPVKTIAVKDKGKIVKKINELEYVNGFIFANVWETNWILKIDAASGEVVGKLDLSDLGNEIRSAYQNADVLNGIAYDKNSKAFLVTGKYWPKSYLIRIQ